jgi:DNA recombination-dependent growth factor C
VAACRDNFHLNNEAKLKGMLEEAGFVKVKTFY